MLKDETSAPVDAGPKVPDDPRHNIVVCLGGCRQGGRSEDIGVVFAARRAPATEVSGEMVPTAAALDGGADTSAPASIECMAGCYDDAPRRFPSPGRDEVQRKVRESAAAAVVRLGATPVSAPASDWDTAPPAAAAKPAAKAKAPPHEKSGEWFTRIERSRGSQDTR